MSRRIQRLQQEDQDLNLAPIMNMVIILIPLLLLSVVFVSVSVIDVRTPCLCGLSSSASTAAPVMTVTVSAQPDGFEVIVDGERMPAQGGCAPSGRTICLAEQVDTVAAFKQASGLMAGGQRERGQDVLNAAVAAYDWRALYNTLSELKRQDPRQSTLNIAMHKDMPFAATVRLMDTARNRLVQSEYNTQDAFWNAQVLLDEKRRAVPMYDNPMLSIAD